MATKVLALDGAAHGTVRLLHSDNAGSLVAVDAWLSVEINFDPRCAMTVVHLLETVARECLRGRVMS
jgi:hypothetical protein